MSDQYVRIRQLIREINGVLQQTDDYRMMNFVDFAAPIVAAVGVSALVASFQSLQEFVGTTDAVVGADAALTIP